jgi:hypothetical protein
METTDPNQTHDFDEVRDRAEAYVRDEPTKAVGLAVLAGIFLTVFPVGSVLFGVIRLALGLLKPALIVLGAVKLYEEVEKRYGT